MPSTKYQVPNTKFQIPSTEYPTIQNTRFTYDYTKYHNAFNGGEEDRVHLVATVLDCNMDIFE